MATVDDNNQTPGSAITSIKAEVARAIKSADAAVQVHTTDYFNNTYAPDLVLTWPRQAIERHVYLRTSADVNYLIDDVSLIGETNSIVMPLADLAADPQAEGRRQELQVASRSHKSLVTQPRSFAELGERRASDPVIGLASRSLLQGGSGYIAPERAVGFGRSLSSGFLGAQTANSSVTGEAIHDAEHLLDPARASEVNGFLHAVWVGSGGDGTSFPGAAGVTATTTGAGLDLLLQTVLIDDPLFWARMARSLSFAKLAEMSANVDDPNFQNLIRAAANVLRAKALRIVQGADSTHDDARWFLLNGELGIRFKSVTAMFAAGRVGDFKQPGLGVVTSIASLQRRADRGRIRLTEVTVGTQDRHFDYGSEDGGTITQDRQLSQFASALGTSAEVRKVIARVGERDLLADFPTSTAHGRTVATFYLSELVQHLPLFADFTASEVAELIRTGLGVDESAIETGEGSP